MTHVVTTSDQSPQWLKARMGQAITISDTTLKSIEDRSFVSPAQYVCPWTSLETAVDPQAKTSYAQNACYYNISDFAPSIIDRSQEIFSFHKVDHSVLGEQTNFDSETYSAREQVWARQRRRGFDLDMPQASPRDGKEAPQEKGLETNASTDTNIAGNKRKEPPAVEVPNTRVVAKRGRGRPKKVQ